MTNAEKRIARRFRDQLRRSRLALGVILVPLLPLAVFSGIIDSTLRLAYIILGFSLIIFLHELGHFMVARACSVKCLAFSIGIGPRMLGWRKGKGLTFGKDPFDPDTQKPAKKKDSKTSGEKEDEKYALKELDPKKVVEQTEKGPVEIQPDTANLTADILGKPAPAGDAGEKHHPAGHAVQSDLPTVAEMPAHPRNVGDTDYRVSWLPLGGYVRMLGQDDMDPTKVSDDPRAFNNRPIWQRMCIVSAGVIMNLIFAAVCFSVIFSPGIGVDFPPAIIGDVQYDQPAWKAGLKMGDEILAIDGEKPRGFLEFTDIAMKCALSTGQTPIKFLVRPYNTHGESDRTVDILPVRNDYTGFLALGVDSLQGMKVAGSSEDYLLVEKEEKDPGDLMKYKENHDALAKIRKGDEIIAVDGRDVRGNYIAMFDYIQSKNGATVKLTLENKDKSQKNQDIELVPHMETVLGLAEFPAVMGLRPRVTVGPPSKGFPAAAAGMKENDVILSVGERSNPTVMEFKSIVSNSGGNPLPFVIERDGQQISLTITPKFEGGKWLVGLPLSQDVTSLRFAPPPVNSAVDALNLPADARIAAINGHSVSNWHEIYKALRGEQPGQPVAVTFATGKAASASAAAGTTMATTGPIAAAGAETLEKSLTLSKEDATALATLTVYRLGVRIENLTRNQHGANAGEAMLMGMDHTKKFILQVYMTLAGLFRQTVSADNLHGIIGIGKIGYDVQERGIVWLWYVLAMVSVNLAVANFLPLPIVDGGLFLLLILEKIRGRPLSLKVQSAIQVVGIVLLAGLFLFVTKNDIGMLMK